MTGVWIPISTSTQCLKKDYQDPLDNDNLILVSNYKRESSNKIYQMIIKRDELAPMEEEK